MGEAHVRERVDVNMNTERLEASVRWKVDPSLHVICFINFGSLQWWIRMHWDDITLSPNFVQARAWLKDADLVIWQLDGVGWHVIMS